MNVPILSCGLEPAAPEDSQSADRKLRHPRTSAIVAAFNEAATIHSVVIALLGCRMIDEVIVVDDGSTDGTSERLPPAVRCIRNSVRGGKGEAMELAVRSARGDILCFADADLVGLTPQAVTSLVAPVLAGDADMMVGLRWLPRYRIRPLRAVVAKLSGERVLTRSLWNSVPDRFRSGFQIEAALNMTARRAGLKVGNQLLPGVKQIVKERKRGLLPGLGARFWMSMEVALTYVRLIVTGRA
ncbi:glycosyl transferase family 2 [Catenulispora acidiphila DSM 44928]|uniref:Glucosyl-3-phosphoglycerate synthase n=1 Tax=Catenulispora acidiphila (strain DSM 44928 / JCM 14897 / NBRC 102108 / NRRL B-24433 / ID139908) TaxID=479433 RepID=C7Q3I8_CATAD|nr:glycosyltransferase family 2 protein [Catenulispora acidiphila]ACU75753.1 glycosyl transferase family 2 [Catenulispora acidiphila DSM 44928]